jgi:hypothetical protein
MAPDAASYKGVLNMEGKVGSQGDFSRFTN